MGYKRNQINHSDEFTKYCLQYGFSKKNLQELTVDAVFEELYCCWSERIKQKKYTYEAYLFERNLGAELLNIANQIVNVTWQPAGYRDFKVYHPERIISAPTYPDRIVEAWHTDKFIVPYWQDKVLSTNMACQRNKGPDKLVELLKSDLEQFYRIYGRTFWFYQFDIKGYYDNISQDFCKKNFAGMNPYGYFLLENIIDSWETKDCYAKLKNPEGHFGFPKGTLTSQWIGITSLNELDHMLNDLFRPLSQYRYMDDGLLIFPDKESCVKAHKKIEQYLLEKRLGIELHPQKTAYAPITRGFNFCGWHFRLRENDGSVEMKVRQDRKVLKKQEIKSKQRAYKNNYMSWGEISQSLQSTFAHYAHGDTSKLKKYLCYRYRFSHQ